MRLIFIQSVIVAATFHVSNAALTTKDSNQATIANVPSAGISGVPEANNGRLLRRVEKDSAFDNETDEERIFQRLGAYLKKIPSKMKKSWKESTNERMMHWLEEDTRVCWTRGLILDTL
ncbi:hypothetical protein GN958_ATG08778 [Phytophthora infestans]|uniref:RxLR effector protein n=1 Tax=Phytophthora infestans TaxID=4787 RepID=A0A8S9UN98_PHYIN|nr:hypothetical protein GN958_ATG08778 [Phytophthora infestans]